MVFREIVKAERENAAMLNDNNEHKLILTTFEGVVMTTPSKVSK